MQRDKGDIFLWIVLHCFIANRRSDKEKKFIAKSIYLLEGGRNRVDACQETSADVVMPVRNNLFITRL